MHRALFSRLVALFVVGVIMAPAIGECAGWSASAAGRHACCAKRGSMAPETSMTACCGMSEESSETAPAQTQLTRTPLKLLGAHFAPVAVSPLASHTLIPGESSSLPRSAIVPLYLQQASLLI
jgi:hypothetical protein